jgi:2-polyprenyl-6-methoxyphenol hydroxylase-like FAD-dependent oxidoreductase
MKLQAGSRVHVHGAGVAGCCLAVELARQRPELDVRLYETSLRRPGAGVVMARSAVQELARSAPHLLDVPVGATATWDATLVRAAGSAIRSPAHGTVAFSRRALTGHLRSLAAGTSGVTVVRAEARDAMVRAPVPALVVGADGAESWTRKTFGHRTTRVRAGDTVYVWASVAARLPAMFDVRETAAGMVLLHVYPHADAESTVVVESLATTVGSLGLTRASGTDLEERLGALLAGATGGAALRCHSRTWTRFATVRCTEWYRTTADGPPRSVLVGDAAHAMHYSVGMGTTLAVEDGRALAAALATEATVDDAFARYAEERRPVADAAHDEAESSRQWFDEFIAANRVRGAQSVFELRSRRAVNTYAVLAAKDPRFAERVVAMIDHQDRDASGRPVTRPSDVPFRHGSIAFGNRLLGRRDLGRFAVRPSAVEGLLGLVEHTEGEPGAGRYALALVAAERDRDRTARSRPAAAIRRRLGTPVLYVHDGASLDELDTLIAAGRIDLAVDRRDVPPGWRRHRPAALPEGEIA